jgi:PAS domain-containing protein
MPCLPQSSPPHELQKPPRASSLALNGLPIYSASGFDMLDILARVATRPQPKVALGPVDLTCSFLVVDITRDDSPIIYASATFTELTGYTEAEILGKNCRFLQAPPGVSLERGGSREHTDIDSVAQMAQSVSANRECQVTLVNYRKSGEPFINCVSIIPIVPGGNEPVRYHVGFQVDLAIQPLAIMRSVQNGSYITNYSSTPLPPVIYQPNKLNIRSLSKDMADVLNRTGTVTDPSSMNDSQDRHRLSLLLLEECSGN